MLSQHAVETNHRLGKSDMLSQHALQTMQHIIEAAKAQNSVQADTGKIAVEPEETCTRRASRTSSYNTLEG